MYNGIGLSSVRGTATSGHVQTNRSHVRNNRVRHQRERNVSQRATTYNPVSAVARERGNKEIQMHERLRRLENSLLEYRLYLEENRIDVEPEDIDSHMQKEREKRLMLLEKEESTTNKVGDAEARFASRKHNNRDRGYGGYYNNKNTDRLHQGENTGGGVASRRIDTSNGGRAIRGDRFGRSQYRRSDSRGDRISNTNSHVDANLKEEENKRLAEAFGINKEKHIEGQAFDRKLQEERRREILEKKEKSQKDAEKANRKIEREKKRKEKALRKEERIKRKKTRGRSRTKRRRYRSYSSSNSSSDSSSKSYSRSSSRSFSSSSSSYSSRSSKTSSYRGRSSRPSSYSSHSSRSSSQRSMNRRTRRRPRRDYDQNNSGDKRDQSERKRSTARSRRWNAEDRQSRSRSPSIETGSVGHENKKRRTKKATVMKGGGEGNSENNDKSGTKTSDNREDEYRGVLTKSPTRSLSGPRHSESKIKESRKKLACQESPPHSSSSFSDSDSRIPSTSIRCRRYTSSRSSSRSSSQRSQSSSTRISRSGSRVGSRPRTR